MKPQRWNKASVGLLPCNVGTRPPDTPVTPWAHSFSRAKFCPGNLSLWGFSLRGSNSFVSSSSSRSSRRGTRGKAEFNYANLFLIIAAGNLKSVFFKCALYYSGCDLGRQHKHYLCVWVCAHASLCVCSDWILLRPRLQLAETSGIRPAAAAAAIGLSYHLRLTCPTPLTWTFHFYAFIKPMKYTCNCPIFWVHQSEGPWHT